MKKNIVMPALFLASLSLVAYADENTKTVDTGGGTVEIKTDTSKNPLTGNTTTTQETLVKDEAGHTLSKRELKVKKGKRGQLMKKTLTKEKADAEGNTTSKTKSEETHSQ